MSSNIDLLSMLDEQKKEAAKTYSDQASILDKISTVLLLLIIAFVPIITLGSSNPIIPPVISDNYYVSLTSRGEYFGYYKYVALLLLTILLVIVFAVKVFFKHTQIKKSLLNYFVGASIIVFILSSIFAEAKSISVFGYANRFEGSLTWSCYLIVFFIAMNTELPKKIVHYVLISLIPFILINLWIMLTFFYGDSIFAYKWVRDIIGSTLPNGYGVPSKAAIVGTLNQWNYMSGMFSTLTIMYLAASIYVNNPKTRILYFCLAIITTAITLMSISTSGFAVICFFALVLIAISFKYNMWRKTLKLAGIYLIAFFVLLHIFSIQDPKVYDNAVGMIVPYNPYVDVQPNAATSGSTPKKDYTQTEDGYMLPTLPQTGMSMLSGRGYIWDKTILMSLDKPLLGYGLDTTIYFFPHTSIEARGEFKSENLTVNKPHSLYLTFIEGVGLVGSIPVFLLFLGIAWLALREFKGGSARMSIGFIFGVGFCAYLLQGIVNDSVLGISAPLWAIAGIGVAILTKPKEEKYFY